MLNPLYITDDNEAVALVIAATVQWMLHVTLMNCTGQPNHNSSQLSCQSPDASRQMPGHWNLLAEQRMKMMIKQLTCLLSDHM